MSAVADEQAGFPDFDLTYLVAVARDLCRASG
jgi:hypothetical protein